MKKRIFKAASLLLVSSVLVGCGRLTVATDNTKESESVFEEFAKKAFEEANTLSTINSCDVYEYIDPDTGVHYLIYSSKNGYAGMGGMTPRLNADGSLMIGEKEKSGYQRD